MLQLGIVVVAAGQSARMGFDKLWVPVHGRPLLEWTLEAVRLCRAAEIVLVVAPDQLLRAAELAPDVRVVPGGMRRRDSVAAGVRVTGSHWVAIHDGARPLASPGLFAAGLAAAAAVGAAVPGVRVKETIKRVEGPQVCETLDRAHLRAIQTPQVFRRDLLWQALTRSDADVSDEAVLIERAGRPVALFEGDERNIKVTTPFDLALLRQLLDADHNQQA